MNFKLVISDPKSKKAYQKEVEQKQTGLIGKKIGEKVSGDAIGLTGYELVVTGGSDRQGFPMRGDVDGIGRKKVLIAMPPGFHPKVRGQRKRKSVRGNTISPQISQVNIKVMAYGKESLDKLLGAKPKGEKVKEKPEGKKEPEKEAKPEVKAEEKPKEEKKEESKPEKPKEEKPKEEKPAEEKMGVKDLEKVEKEAKEKESKDSKEDEGKKK